MTDDPLIVVAGPCYCCGQVFSFNPHRVPSHMIDPTDPSTRAPICRTCIALVNASRVDAGLEPFPVYEDAYDPIRPADL
jgi:hypothetical protein